MSERHIIWSSGDPHHTNPSRPIAQSSASQGKGGELTGSLIYEGPLWEGPTVVEQADALAAAAEVLRAIGERSNGLELTPAQYRFLQATSASLTQLFQNTEGFKRLVNELQPDVARRRGKEHAREWKLKAYQAVSHLFANKARNPRKRGS